MKDLNIFNFSNYRHFLLSYAEEKRKSSPLWSYGAWAKRLGLSTTSGLTMVLNGQRFPGPKVREGLIDYFKMDSAQKRYFEDLVKLERYADDPRITALLIKDLAGQNPSGKFHELSPEEFSVISEWHYLAIREMTLLPGFQNDPQWVQKRLHFNVSIPQIKKALKTLEQVGLLHKDKQGKLTQTHKTIDTTNDLASQAIKQFHEGTLDLGAQALHSLSVEERQFRSLTLNIKQKKLKQVGELITKFQDEVSALLEDPQGNTTCQLNIQFFPLTKIRSQK